MNRNSSNRWFQSLMLALVFALGGCAGSVKNMSLVPQDRIVSGPQQGKALVVFLRPSSMAFSIQSVVSEIVDNKPSLVGIVASGKKVAYQVNPGKHLFMVTSESGDFLSADLEKDKTYYALVTPRMGAWKARFSLKPIPAGELNSSEFNDWLESCEWVEPNADSLTWATNHMSKIQSLYDDNYARWMEKDPASKPHLGPQDGR
jgi:hypothetical protein